MAWAIFFGVVTNVSRDYSGCTNSATITKVGTCEEFSSHTGVWKEQ